MRDALTGSRIRERRILAGLKQADLARDIGISASYLNLIEHNRRRIGGKLLLGIARALGVAPQVLTEGAEASLIASLREAASEAKLPEAEAAQADEFASRFPGWAETLARARRHVAALERTIEELTDRLAHDPHLAASMHELLSTAAAVRSTAAILADEQGLEPEWRQRFHANINEDSRRLADSAQAIARVLEQGSERGSKTVTPQEEVEIFLAAQGFRFEALEAGEQSAAQVIEGATALGSPAARYIAAGVLAQISRDAALLPMARLEEALGKDAPDPAVLARRLGVPVPAVLRRLAGVARLGAGLVVCDRSGTVIYRKSVSGFAVPGFGANCPLWPLFAALSQPGLVVRERITQQGGAEAAFDSFAAAEVQGTPGYNRAPMVQSVMLLVPQMPGSSGAARRVGASCRICAQRACGARREPSILMGIGMGGGEAPGDDLGGMPA